MKYLPSIVDCCNFINADMIAAGISPLSPELAQMQAARIFLSAIQDNISKNKKFAFETTLSGRAYVKLLKRLKIENWKLILIYLWIPDIEFSKKRVNERVQQGGHNIPLDAIKRRYRKSISNLFNLYMPLCDYTLCFDNSTMRLKPIFETDIAGINVLDNKIYTLMREHKNG